MRTRSTAADVRLHAPTRQSGFTLVELTVSMTIGAILLGGMASAVLIASHALPGRNTATDAILRASDLVEQIAGELHCAVAFTQRSATMVEITVPDRNKNQAPEAIRYAWSGTPGDPLTRQYNAGPVVNVAEHVQEFDLGYTTTSVTTTDTVTTVLASGEILLSSFDGWSGLTETPQDVGVDSDYWAAQSFSGTSIPTDASKVTITRALLKLRQGALGGAGTFSVAIHPTQGGGNPKPHMNPIGTPVVRSASTLSAAYLWEEFVFSDVYVNNANQEKVIVVKGTAAPGTQGDAEILRYYAHKAPKIDSNALWTTDGGAKWDPRKNLADYYQFPFYVYGEYETTETVPTDVTRYYLDSVGIKLRIGTDARTRAQTAAQVLNAPEVTGP